MFLNIISPSIAIDFFDSEQQLVDCDTTNSKGCRGGDPYWALDYYKNSGGAATVDAYGPNTGKDGICTFDNQTAPITVASYGRVGKTVPDIQSAILKYGPVPAKLYVGDTFTGKLNDNKTAWIIHFYK